MLRHPDRSRRAADRLGGLLRTHADHHAQDEDLPLLLGQDRQERVHPGGGLGLSIASCSGPASPEKRSGTTSVASELVTPGGAMCVGNLVGGDAVDKGQERSSLILVARQRRDGSQAHLLSNVVC